MKNKQHTDKNQEVGLSILSLGRYVHRQPSVIQALIGVKMSLSCLFSPVCRTESHYGLHGFNHVEGLLMQAEGASFTPLSESDGGRDLQHLDRYSLYAEVRRKEPSFHCFCNLLQLVAFVVFLYLVLLTGKFLVLNHEDIRSKEKSVHCKLPMDQTCGVEGIAYSYKPTENWQLFS